MVSFLTQEPGAYFPPHRHESEQVMIVVDGEEDEIVKSKLGGVIWMIRKGTYRTS